MPGFDSKLRGIRRVLRKATFKEEEHPRDDDGKFTCKDCGAEHGSEKELNDHRTEKHTDTPEKSKADIYEGPTDDPDKDYTEEPDESVEHIIFDPKTGELKNQTLHPDEAKAMSGGRTRVDINRDLEIARSDYNQYNKKRRKALDDNDLDRSQMYRRYMSEIQDDIYKLEEERKNHKDPKKTVTGIKKERVIELVNKISDGGLSIRLSDVERQSDIYSLINLGLATMDSGLSHPGPYRRVRLTADGRLFLKNQKKTGSMLEGKMQTGSMVDSYKSGSGDRYVSYFLINSKENLKKWGVTPDSIPRHIGSFKGMPFVITSKKFFATSPYGDVTDHPSTDHFANLGIKVGVNKPKEVNDMMQQASFQEEFRVGNIEDVFNKGDDYFALIKVNPKFANHQMPPLVSPAVFQLNPHEPANKITTWIGMHLAGLDEKPAYGNAAIFKGSCVGTKGECLRQLSAKLDGMVSVLPCTKNNLALANLKIAKLRLDLMKTGVQMSSDHTAIQVQNILDEDDEEEIQEI